MSLLVNLIHICNAGIKGVAVVSGPLIQNNKNRTVDGLFHITDWKPTFLSLAGGSDHDVDGYNQWNTLSAGFSPLRRVSN